MSRELIAAANHFDAETEIALDDVGCWHGHMSPHWNIGDNPNGGYMLCCVLRAVANSVPHPDPISVTTHFLRPGTPDAPFEISVDVVRTGRSVSTTRATLSQAGKARLEVLCAFGDLSQSAGVEHKIDAVPRFDLPPPDDCPERSGETQGLHLPIMARLDVRLNPAHAVAGAADHADMSGWIRFVDERAADSLTLPMFADAFPPSPLALLGPVGWVPTLELTVQVRRRPQPGWVRAEFSTDDLDGGRMIETGKLFDSAGQLVAQSRQLGLVMNLD